MKDITIILQVLVAACVFFVWVVRYDNIVEECRSYGLSDKLRDFVGIMKLTLALLLVVGVYWERLAMVGGLGIALLMACAFATHVKSRTEMLARLPSLSLLVVSSAIVMLNYPVVYP